MMFQRRRRRRQSARPESADAPNGPVLPEVMGVRHETITGTLGNSSTAAPGSSREPMASALTAQQFIGEHYDCFPRCHANSADSPGLDDASSAGVASGSSAGTSRPVLEGVRHIVDKSASLASSRESRFLSESARRSILDSVFSDDIIMPVPAQ
ncbi:hypothetical protein QAD02_007056 [Eretmocerus hayati]|uniref:Uncharacterized protein n=1 Tax=Eretmocerus hayati TaxID=131215 RepID=A0ACC2N2K0_9HYME|nr:hypothetical protein QAD02_007056 [Eretmocerus hayati]